MLMPVLLTLSTTLGEGPDSDLGFLLHKHPDRAQSFDVMAGRAHVYYPRADEYECTAALLLETDPVELARQARQGGSRALGPYVNDRPYVASSLLAVALGKVFRTALAGRCAARPELATRAVPLRIELPAVPHGREPELPRRLFEPLGWEVEHEVLHDPDRGATRYGRLTLRGEHTVSAALNQLYVLLPVLDDAKHYWVDQDEIDKLLRAGGAWLASHPERELISGRYLVHARPLVDEALRRLTGDAGTDHEDDVTETRPLAAQRRAAVLEVLRATGSRSVVDLGCGDGKLLRDLLDDAEFGEILGVDVSTRALRAAERTLRLERRSERENRRIRLRQSALTYTDSGLTGYDAAVLMEVIEHVDPERLPALEHAVFGHARPALVVLTTPNSEYNAHFPELVGGTRHPDHRFEFDRAEFAEWTRRVASTHGYTATSSGVGEADQRLGQPTQLAVFTRDDLSDGGTTS
ncbi:MULTISPECIES: 3' terminal RNA ribose 2'-O-methyltransferase Hen1 [unclassified Actinopolyspora]|uniref:3' terminal RNA ribose 2'-O-methyltransferase Hen1 n=1 Tax=unclassified Actinopolyspora TaxID=2639451 RepID=UPI001F608613|nr:MULTISPECIES: 3' terminal RNA ribose 2'-O-methyltransferase Hen1 [unclassified Actinopolyspora]